MCLWFLSPGKAIQRAPLRVILKAAPPGWEKLARMYTGQIRFPSTHMDIETHGHSGIIYEACALDKIL